VDWAGGAEVKTIKADGITWLVMPQMVYAAKYRLWTITIRRCTGFKGRWRLYVSRGGGSIAFEHQFYTGIHKARIAGKAMVDSHPDTDRWEVAGRV
jgi:hypothetical protein